MSPAPPTEHVSSTQERAHSHAAASTSAKRQVAAGSSMAPLGLSNLGNTCFFNSAAQLLFSCPQLAASLRQSPVSQPRRQCPGSGCDQAAASNADGGQQTTQPKGPLGFALQQAFIHVHAGTSGLPGARSTYNPQALFAAICRHAPQFKGRQQQDSHELLRVLLDGLQAEDRCMAEMQRKRRLSRGSGLGLPPCSNEALPGSSPEAPTSNGNGNASSNAVLFQPLSPAFTSDSRNGQGSEEALALLPLQGPALGHASSTEQLPAEVTQAPPRAALQVADAPLPEPQSLVDRIFGGMLESTVTCLSCGHRSVTCEPFCDLSLPVPQPQQCPTASSECSSATSSHGDARAEAEASADRSLKRVKGKKAQRAAAASAAAAAKDTAAAQHRNRHTAETNMAVSISSYPEASKPAKKLRAKEKTRQKAAARHEAVEKAREARRQQRREALSLSSGGSSSSLAGSATDAGRRADIPQQQRCSPGPSPQQADSSADACGDACVGGGSTLEGGDQAATAANGHSHGVSLAPSEPVGSAGTAAACARSGSTSPVAPVLPQLGFQASRCTVAAASRQPAELLGRGPLCSSHGRLFELFNGCCEYSPSHQGPPAAVAPAAAVPQPCSAGSPAVADATSTAPGDGTPDGGALPSTLFLAVDQRGQGCGESSKDNRAAHTCSAPAAAARRQHSSVPAMQPGTTLHQCLAAFFAKEQITWACAKERVAWRSGVTTPEARSLGGAESVGRSASNGAAAAEDSGGCGWPAVAFVHPPLRKQVSWSEHRPRVTLIPGSVEQRGTDLASAMQGLVPFCRPARHQGTPWLVTAQLDSMEVNVLRLRVVPGWTGGERRPVARGEAAAAAIDAATAGCGDPPASPLPSPGPSPGPSPRASPPVKLSLPSALAARLLSASGSAAVAAAVSIGQVDVSAAWRCSVEEQCVVVPQVAQLALDCVADLLHKHGAEGTRAVMAAGAQLSEQGGRWRLHVRRSGSSEADDGAQEGAWVYPSRTKGGEQDDTASSQDEDVHSLSASFLPVRQELEGARDQPARVQSGGELAAAAASSRVCQPDSPPCCGLQRQHLGPLGGNLTYSVVEEDGWLDGSGRRGSEADEMFDIDDVVRSPLCGHLALPVQADAAKSPTQACVALAEAAAGRPLRSSSGSTGAPGGVLAPGAACSRQPTSPAWRPTVSSSRTAAGSTQPSPPPGSSDTAAGVPGTAPSGGRLTPMPAAPFSTLAGCTPGRVPRAPSGGRPALPDSSSKPAHAFHRPASKRYRLSRAPKALMLHLKRFTQDETGRLSKLNTHVAFDWELDCRPYLAPPDEPMSDEGAAHPGDLSRWATVPPLLYELVGLIEHSGQLRSGHYVAYVRRPAVAAAVEDGWSNSSSGNSSSGGPGAAACSATAAGHAPAWQWYYASDTNVKTVPLAQVARAQAYILLYSRKGGPCGINE